MSPAQEETPEAIPQKTPQERAKRNRERVVAQDEAYLAKSLRMKKLPPVVAQSYERHRMLADNAGMVGPLPVSLLINLVAQTDAQPAEPEAKKAAPKK